MGPWAATTRVAARVVTHVTVDTEIQVDGHGFQCQNGNPGWKPGRFVMFQVSQKVPKQRIRRAGLGEMARKQVGLGFLMIARALNVPPAT